MGTCFLGYRNCPWCDADIWDRGVSVVTAVASRGDQVRVEFEAEYTGIPNPDGPGKPDKYMLKVNGKETWVPDSAKVTVVKKALPTEPPKGAVVVFVDGTVWARYTGGGCGWISLTSGNDYDYQSWESVINTHGTKFEHIVRPQSFYWFAGVGPITLK